MQTKDDDISKPNTEGPKKIDSDWKAKVRLEKEKAAMAAKTKPAGKTQKPPVPAPAPVSQTPPAGNEPGHDHAHDHGHDHEHEHGHEHGPEDGHAHEEQQPSAGGVEEQPEEAQEALNASEANFLNFISSMAAQVMISLGQEPHPVTHRMELSIEQASYTIDILVMLKGKTKGNLTKQEERFFNQILYQLQLVYTQIVKQLEQRNKPGMPQV